MFACFKISLLALKSVGGNFPKGDMGLVYCCSISRDMAMVWGTARREVCSFCCPSLADNLYPIADILSVNWGNSSNVITVSTSGVEAAFSLASQGK